VPANLQQHEWLGSESAESLHTQQKFQFCRLLLKDDAREQVAAPLTTIGRIAAAT